MAPGGIWKSAAVAVTVPEPMRTCAALVAPVLTIRTCLVPAGMVMDADAAAAVTFWPLPYRGLKGWKADILPHLYLRGTMFRARSRTGNRGSDALSAKPARKKTVVVKS